MEYRSSSCLAFIRDAFIIFHQQFLGTKAYTHFCSPSAIVPFATLRDIEQPFLPQLGLSNLWVTGNSSQTGLIVSNLWPYAMRAARGPRWETLPGDVRPFCSFPVLWAGTHGSPLVVNVSGTLCSWRCFILGSLCATLVFQAYQAGRHVFWHSLIVFGAWKFVGEPGLGWVAAYIALNLVSIWWCFQCADRWQQPGTDKLRDLMRCWCRKRRKPSKGTLNRQKSPEDICFFGVFGGSNSNNRYWGPGIIGIWATSVASAKIRDLERSRWASGAMHGSITRFVANISSVTRQPGAMHGMRRWHLAWRKKVA